MAIAQERIAHYDQIARKPGYKENPWPTIDLDKWDVAPGNLASSNQANIANMITRLRSANIPGFHVKLNRAGTFGVSRGVNGSGLDLYATRKACILLPSNCTFELSPDSVIQQPAGNKSYLIRNDDPINGNENITIKGGVWDGNFRAGGQTSEYESLGVQGYYGMSHWWENIDGFIMQDIVFRDPCIWTTACGRMNRAFFDRIHFEDCYRDGLHFVGENHNINISRISGTTDDNTLAFSTSQGGYFGDLMQYATTTPEDVHMTHGSMSGISINDCQFTLCDGPIALFGAVGSIKGVTITNLRGTTSADSSGVVLTPIYPTIGPGVVIDDIVIDNINMRSGNGVGEFAVSLLSGDTKNAQISNINFPNGSGVNIAGTSWESLQIDNVQAHGRTLLKLGDSVQSLPFHAKSVQIGRMASAATGLTQPVVNIQSNATWENFSIDDMALNVASTDRLFYYFGATQQRIRINRIWAKGGQGLFVGPLAVDANEITLHDQTYIAENFAKVQSNRLHILGTSVVRCGSNAMFSQAPSWIMERVTFEDFNSGSLTPSKVLRQLPRGARILAVSIKPTIAFAGGATTSATLEVRHATIDIGNTPVDVFTGSANLLFAAPVREDIGYSAAINANLLPYIRLTSNTFGSQLTAGEAYVGILYDIFATEH